ncbi:unnamed protein product, partial [Hapterophycus canaliculatus]
MLTQASVDVGYVSNTATATAYPPSSSAANSSEAENGIMSVEDVSSTSLVSDTSFPYTGDIVAFEITVRNEGTASLAGISLELAILEGTLTAVDCTPILSDTLALAPGGVILCSASLELTQDDVDEGSLSGAVFARGTANDGQVFLAEDAVDQEIVQATGLSVGVCVCDGNGLSNIGDTTTYISTFENTGNVRVGNVIVFHELDQGPDLVCGTGFEAATSINLLPGVEFTCEESYSLTQADVDAATVVNTASIAG